ncbi:hypothetical protein ACJMK2_016399 [Sinanodonta woodiana]|uniref:Uncharacterized protein n=1 Tax=Sinanodonta woodiana TaxID=1069815 RepID=A0ABD3UX34_SINWO
MFFYSKVECSMFGMNNVYIWRLFHFSSDTHQNEDETAYAGHVKTIISITIASLLALIFIALIVIWICRPRVKNHNKRLSIRHPSQSGEPDRVHADTEPVRTYYKEMPSFYKASIPIKQYKRSSSLRNTSMYIRHMLGMKSKPSVSNDSILFNKQSESVQVPLLRPASDFHNEDCKGKGKAACQTIQSGSRPVMDSDSHLLSTSSDVVMEMRQRETVYNPLMIQTYSIPFDELIIGTAWSGAQSTDHVFHGYPFDNGANLQNGD